MGGDSRRPPAIGFPAPQRVYLGSSNPCFQSSRRCGTRDVVGFRRRADVGPLRSRCLSVHGVVRRLSFAPGEQCDPNSATKRHPDHPGSLPANLLADYPSDLGFCNWCCRLSADLQSRRSQFARSRSGARSPLGPGILGTCFLSAYHYAVASRRDGGRRNDAATHPRRNYVV